MPRESHHRRGFTLTELLVVIGLVMILMLAVSRVFTLASRTVGSGQALSTATRDARAVESVLRADVASAIAVDSPGFIITSRRIAAFRNRQDELADRDYPPAALSSANIDRAIRTVDATGDNAETPGTADEIPQAILGQRNFRIDRMGFFARGQFDRVTGNDNTFIAPMRSNEAWVWYGHLRQPDQPQEPLFANQAPRNPGFLDNTNLRSAADNRNNFYASQWSLGRFAVLLREPGRNIGAGPAIVDRNNAEQGYIQRGPPLNVPTSLAPLDGGSNSNGIVPGWTLSDSRLDLAGISIEQFHKLARIRDAFVMGGGGGQMSWHQLIDNRYYGSNFPQLPLTAAGVARISPVLLRNCSSFAVEFAGDYLSQQNNPALPLYGGIFGAGQDGVLDYQLVAGNVRQTRWYGFPRDVDGDGSIPGGGSGIATPLTDVVPVRDVLAQSLFASNYRFERNAPPMVANYGVIGGLPTIPNAFPFHGGVVAGNSPGEYVAAWAVDSPDEPLPTLVRIVFSLDDPDGRLAETQTFEHVIALTR